MKKKSFITFAISREKLLLFNGILCFCYAICFILLIVLPYSQPAVKSSFYSKGVILLNIIFLGVLTLNLNTISVLYAQISKPGRPYSKAIYTITWYVWLAYVAAAYFFTFFKPGFISHLHHPVQHTFHTLAWPMATIALVFGCGLSLLYMEYYRQVNMRHVLVFIIPAVLQFSFKLMLPFLFSIMGWLVFGGCQLLLYFSIVDSKLLAARPRKNLIITSTTTVSTLRSFADV